MRLNTEIILCVIILYIL